MTGPPAQVARDLAERALAGGRLLEDEGPESEQFYTAVQTLKLIGCLERAAHWLDRAIRAAQSHGSLVGYALASAFRAEVCYRMGDLSHAEAHARAAMVFAPGDVTAVLVNTLIERGDVAGAGELFDRHPIDVGTDHLLVQPVVAAWGRLRIAQGDASRGASDLRAVGHWLDRWPVLNPAVVPWRSMLAACLARLGDTGHARELAAEELQQARDLRQAPALGIALRGAALLEDDGDSIALLREAADVLERSAARLEPCTCAHASRSGAAAGWSSTRSPRPAAPSSRHRSSLWR